MNQIITTVLIADDEPSILALTAIILEGAGYNVLRAVDGREALKLGCQHHAEIDVALVDYVMPGMNGSEVAEGLRKLNPEIRVVMMSGYACDQITGSELNLKEISFLRKPFSIAALLVVILNAIEGGSDHAATACLPNT
jgi:two-component system cell cycle sensor histidine kinase/response regulator CckA